MHQGPADVAAAAGEERSGDAVGHVHAGGDRAGGAEAGAEREGSVSRCRGSGSHPETHSALTESAPCRRGSGCRTAETVHDVSEPRGSREQTPAELLPHHPQTVHPGVAAVQQEQLVPLLPWEVTAVKTGCSNQCCHKLDVPDKLCRSEA